MTTPHDDTPSTEKMRLVFSPQVGNDMSHTQRQILEK